MVNSPTQILSWERAEIQRSSVEATLTPDAALRVGDRRFQRYKAPPADTVFPLEYAYHLLGEVRGIPYERPLTDAELQMFGQSFASMRLRAFLLPHAQVGQLLPLIRDHVDRLYRTARSCAPFRRCGTSPGSGSSRSPSNPIDTAFSGLIRPSAVRLFKAQSLEQGWRRDRLRAESGGVG